MYHAELTAKRTTKDSEFQALRSPFPFDNAVQQTLFEVLGTGKVHFASRRGCPSTRNTAKARRASQMAALWDRREAEPERSAYLNVVLGCVTSTPLENLQCSVSPTSAIPLTGTTMRNVLAGIFLFGLVSTALPANGYSVLTHEAIVDSAWNSDIKPLLLRRFS